MPVHPHARHDEDGVLSTRPQFAREPLSVLRHRIPYGELAPSTAAQTQMRG